MKNGFTLIELLATIAIMAILAVAVLPFVSNYRKWAADTVNKRSAQLIYDAIVRYNTLAPTALHTSDVAVWASALTGVGGNAFSAETGVLANPGDKFLAKDPTVGATVTISATEAVTFAKGTLGAVGNAP